MKASLAALLLVLAPLHCGCVSSVSTSQVTPVQKVIELLEGMVVNGQKEKSDEVIQFATYKQFCEDISAEKTRLIKEANEKIELLKADIEKYMVEVAQLTKEIAAHDEDISVWKGDIKAITIVRKLEKTDYEKLHQDLSESVAALEQAIAVLKDSASTRNKMAQASLVQISQLGQMSLIPAEAKRVIDAFLQTDEPEDVGLGVSAPEAYGYEFQSHGIIDTLVKLHDKFIQERTDVEKKEMNTKQAFEMLLQDLNSQVDDSTRRREEQAALKAKKLQAKADAEGDLNDTTTTRDADKDYLTSLVATCETKATDFESRQSLRAAEIEAIGKAIGILGGKEVSGNAEQYLPTLLQTKSTSLSQLRSDGSNILQSKAVTFLRIRASQLNSRVLSALALRAAADPFMKVKKLIKDLLVRLMEEANEEAEHKGWCDTELSTNEKTRKAKTTLVEELHAEIDLLETSIAKLGEDIAELATAVADLDAAMLKATKFREEEKAENELTIKDAGEAQIAIAQALLVLQEFYSKAGEATALLQEQPVAPEIFDSPYTGMQSENGGVVSMIEVIQSDFARLEADTKAAEAMAAEEYRVFMEKSKIDKAEKETDIKNKTNKQQDEEHALVVNKADLEATQKELDAALDYFEKLKPSCVDAGVTYADRVKRRQEEIESLQTALRILNGENIM